MISAIFYLVTTAWLLYNAWTIKKSDRKADFLTSVFLSCLFLLGEQAVFAFIFHFVHIPTGLVSIGVSNLLVGVGLFFGTRKIGKQSYEKPEISAIIGVLIITAVTLYFYKTIWGFSFARTAFGSEDGVKVHRMLAKFLAVNGYYENIQYFEALHEAIWMNLLAPIFGAINSYDKGHMFTQLINMEYTSFGFYVLLRRYRKGVYSDEKKRNILAAVVCVFYLLGYPLYASMFGFAYFVQIMNIIVAIMVLYSLMREKEASPWVLYGMLNILLFAMFPCYSFFVPIVFPALFLAIWGEYKEETGKWFSLDLVKKEVQVFLLPCIFGLINSVSNVKELGDGGGITNDGGCYFDLYSNFLRLLPFVAIGIAIVWKKRKTDLLIILNAWTLVVFAGLFALNAKGKISLYYISKVYNILWLVCFAFIFLAFAHLLEKMPALVVGLALMFALSFVSHSSGLPEKIQASNPPGYITLYDNEHGIYPNVYWFNEQWVAILHGQTHF